MFFHDAPVVQTFHGTALESSHEVIGFTMQVLCVFAWTSYKQTLGRNRDRYVTNDDFGRDFMEK
jgi:hypothetical protein